MTRSNARRRPRRYIVAAFVAIASIALGAVVLSNLRKAKPSSPPGCEAASAQSVVAMDTEQAANASTIAAIGKRLGLPDHGVTVALAAALQESDLRNLDHGDLDSLGLFQQRPSEGWGSPSQIMNPAYAASAFYQRLQRVSRWEMLSVAEAAQAVQHSAAPDAYAQFDQTARTLASALTGEWPAAFTCHYTGKATTAPSTPMRAVLDSEFGRPTLDTPLTANQGWTVCAWLVAHAPQYAIQSVTFSGQEWSARSGRWQPTAAASMQVRVHTATGA